jgi:hypothetical protein
MVKLETLGQHGKKTDARYEWQDDYYNQGLSKKVQAC